MDLYLKSSKRPKVNRILQFLESIDLESFRAIIKYSDLSHEMGIQSSFRFDEWTAASDGMMKEWIEILNSKKDELCEVCLETKKEYEFEGMGCCGACYGSLIVVDTRLTYFNTKGEFEHVQENPADPEYPENY